MLAARAAVIGFLLTFPIMVQAQPFPPGGDVIKAGTRVWVSTTSMDNRWQRGEVVEERLDKNSYLVKTDEYRGAAPQTFNVHWLWVVRLTDECKPPRGAPLIGAGQCKE
jgi:hypothetical protein